MNFATVLPTLATLVAGMAGARPDKPLPRVCVTTSHSMLTLSSACTSTAACRWLRHLLGRRRRAATAAVGCVCCRRAVPLLVRPALAAAPAFALCCCRLSKVLSHLKSILPISIILGFRVLPPAQQGRQRQNRGKMHAHSERTHTMRGTSAGWQNRGRDTRPIEVDAHIAGQQFKPDATTTPTPIWWSLQPCI